MAPPVAATAVVAAAVVPGPSGQASIAVAGGGALSVTASTITNSNGASGQSSANKHSINEDTLKLIDCVRARPALWHRKHLRQRVQVAHRGWEEIRKAFKATEVSSLKVRWKTLRDSFRREVKRMEDGELTTSSWPLFEKMSFLLGHFRTRESYFKGGSLSPETNKAGDESWRFTEDEGGPHNDEDGTGLTSHGESDEGDEMCSGRKRAKYSVENGAKGLMARVSDSDDMHMIETFETVNAGEDDDIQVLEVVPGNREVIELPSHLFGEVTFKNKLRARIKTEPADGAERKVFSGGGIVGDSDYNFLMSLHPFLQQLNTKRNMAVRIKMQQLIAEAMEEN